jgi:hypothetical protein
MAVVSQQANRFRFNKTTTPAAATSSSTYCGRASEPTVSGFSDIVFALGGSAFACGEVSDSLYVGVLTVDTECCPPGSLFLFADEGA